MINYKIATNCHIFFYLNLEIDEKSSIFAVQKSRVAIKKLYV
jgi:hypothetical protein